MEKACNLSILFVIISIFLVSCQSFKPSDNTSQQIVVEAEISKYFYDPLQKIYTLKKEMDITYQNFPDSANHSTTYISTSEVKHNNKVTWVLHTDKIVRVFPPFGASILLNPGDTLHISYLYDYPIYSGKGNPSIAMLSAIMKTEEKLVKPGIKNTYNVKSLEDYLEWSQYLDKKLALQLPILVNHKDKIPDQEYIYYVTNIIGRIEGDRVNAFGAFMSSVKNDSLGLLTTNDLCEIWDSTQYKSTAKWLRSFTSYYGSISDIYAFNKMETFRHFGFDMENDSLVHKSLRTHQYYISAKKKYSGLMREKLLIHILDEGTITELGLKNPIAQVLLKDYYSSPGFPEYKQIVKDLEERKSKQEKESEKKKKA